MDIELSNAFYEVLEVLKFVSKDDYDKISKSFIRFLNENYNENCDFEYNLALPMKEQELSIKAKVILAIICEKYWDDSNTSKEILNVNNDKLEKLIKSEDIKNSGFLLRLIDKITDMLK